jgi:HEPN domain-containing protein
MNVLTTEWIEKAEGDFFTATREIRVRTHPNYDTVCFHAQQCAEKYLKAFLEEVHSDFPRTHHLIDLLELCVSFDASFELQRDILIRLDGYAVRSRYPGHVADLDEARMAFQAVKLVRAFIRSKLNLPES